MARAYNIWVVIPQGRMIPIASFTVKHELKTWLSRRAPEYHIYKIPDGGGGHIETQNVTKDFY